jgi:hypothetical protein
VPLPVCSPAAAASSVIQDTLEVAVHLQPFGSSTVAVFFDWPGGT